MPKKTPVFKVCRHYKFLYYKNEYLKKKGYCAAIRNLIIDLYKGESPIVLVVGAMGKGKSTFACRLAEIIMYELHHTTWPVDKNLFFFIKDFADRIETAQSQPLILDEAEEDLNSDEWFSIQNKFFGRVLMTQRIKGNCYIIVLPNAKELALRHRRLINYTFWVRSKSTVICKKTHIKADELQFNEIGRQLLSVITPKLPKNMDIYNKYQQIDRENKNAILKTELADLRAGMNKDKGKNKYNPVY